MSFLYSIDIFYVIDESVIVLSRNSNSKKYSKNTSNPNLNFTKKGTTAALNPINDLFQMEF